jgi:hypothetical protein
MGIDSELALDRARGIVGTDILGQLPTVERPPNHGPYQRGSKYFRLILHVQISHQPCGSEYYLTPTLR